MTYDRDEVRKLERDIEVSRGNRFDFYSASDKAPSESKPTYADLEAENQRLRDALQRIAEHTGESWETFADGYVDVKAIAREASDAR